MTNSNSNAKTPGPELSVWADEETRSAYVRIGGRANFSASTDFKHLIEKLSALNFRRFVLELSTCKLMDSTFLGTLAGVTMKYCNAKNGCDGAVIQLVNANDRILDLLENLGITHLFEVKCAELPTSDLTPVPHEPVKASALEMAEDSLTAHKALVAANPANADKFIDVNRFLADDIERIKARQAANQPPPGPNLGT